jgi:ubiquinone/menaquinone biosynthesis C-methylase UbiE
VDRVADQKYLVGEQYRDSSNLSARIRLHKLFSTNGYGWHRWVFDHLADLPDDARILELGCGRGDVWAENLDRIPPDWRIILSDLSPGMIENARSSLEGSMGLFDYEVIDAQSIPYPEATFDGVVANHMLYHVPDRAKGIAEIHRVLKPGGLLFAATNGRGNMAEIKDLLDNARRAKFDLLANRFRLEDGKRELREVFPRVTVHCYRDALHVSDAGPVIDYINSTGRKLNDRQASEIRRRVQDRIDCDGKFVIQKTNGTLTARK